MTLGTAIPRGLKSFVVRRADLAAKPLNDTILLQVLMTLPAGFGYILNELHLNIEVARQQDWNPFVSWRVSRSSRATENMDYFYAIPWESSGRNGVSTFVRSTVITAGNLLRTPIIPGQNPNGVTMTLAAQNLNTTDAAAGTVNAVVSFWEFDLEQIQYYPPHSATNVVTR